jgi:hypothetical protein
MEREVGARHGVPTLTTRQNAKINLLFDFPFNMLRVSFALWAVLLKLQLKSLILKLFFISISIIILASTLFASQNN